MTLLLPLVALISEQPGIFVYHLVMIAWLMVAAVGALGQASRAPSPTTARAALAALSLFTLQLIYFLLVCLASAALFNPNLILPPFDRALSATVILIFIWCANFPDPSRPGDAFTALLLVIIGLALGGSLWWWNAQLAANPQLFFNGVPETPWETGKMALLGVGALILLLRRRSQWPLALAGLSLLLLGHFLHYFLGQYFALKESHFPGIERLADLLAIPLLAALLLRRSQAAPTHPAPTASLDDTAPRPVAAPRPLTLDVPTATTLASLSIAEGAALAQAITQTLARAFHAEMCLWLDAPDRPGGPQLAGAYDLTREQFLPARLILLSEMPHVMAALKVSGLTQLTPETHLADLRHMTRAVGREPITPALLAPLHYADGPALGALILLTPQRVWTSDEQNLFTALAEAFAGLLHTRAQAAHQRADFDRLTAELAQAHQTDASLQARLTQVAADLAAVQTESQRLLAEAGQTKAEINRQRLVIEDLTFQLQTRQQLEASHTALMGEVTEMRGQLVAAQQAALERLDALTVVEQQLETAQREATEYREQERQLREDLKQARAEWAARETDMAARASPAETAALTEAAQAREQHLQLEVFRLTTELAEAQALSVSYLAAQADRAAAVEQAAQLRAELTDAHRTLEHAQEQEAELRQALAHLHQDVQQQTQTAAAFTALQTEFHSLGEQLAEARAESEQLRADVAEAQTWNTALTATQAALDEAAAKLALAQDEAQQHRTALETTRAELARAQEQVAEAQAAAPQQRTEVEQLRAELNHAISQRMSYAVQLDDKTRALTTLQAELVERAEEAETLRAKLDDHRRAVEPWQSNFERVQTRPLPKFPLPPAAPPTAAPTSTGDREVVNSLSQELRQPMSSISGYTDLLLSESVGILGALQRKFLERIKASTERMGALLDDLIHVTTLDAGALALTHESLDVTAALEEAVQSCEAQFRERTVELSLDLTPDLPRLNADRDALRQIFTHLLHNAAAVSPANSEVVLTMRREVEPGQHLGPPSQYLLIAVRDSGSGIAPEDQPRVFSRLYRADAPLVAGVGDTGVGLSMVKALVEAHGGRIWVTSQPEAGSTFYVLLPLNNATPANGRNGGQP